MSRGIVALALSLMIAVHPAVSAQGAAHPQQFASIGLMVPDGDKATEVDVVVRFEDEALVILNQKLRSEIKRLRYDDMKSGEYSYSKSPRWKSGAGVALAIGVFALPIFFMKGKKHWFTVQAADDYAVLHLDKKNYKLVLAAFETHTDVAVETLGEEK